MLHNCFPDAECLGRLQVSSLPVFPESVSSHKLRSFVSLGLSITILTPFVCVTPHPPPQLDSWMLAQYLAVNFCKCFQQLLDGGSVKTVREVTNLIIAEDQFRHLLQYFLES